MLMLKLLLTASALCLWGEKSNATCGGDAKLSECKVIVTCGDDAKTARCVVISADKTLGCCAVSVGDGGRIAAKKSPNYVLVSTAAQQGIVYRLSGDDESIADRIRAPKGSDIWIGVRMAPVPAPLAAHLGDAGGLMVANVAKDSPADKAGLRQYDVITAFAGDEINSTDDLVNAIAENGKSRTRITVLRGGDQKSLRIKPASRPESGEMTFKYDEGQDTVVQDGNVRFRGRMLLPGRDGVWQLKDLGDLEGLPEALESLKGLKGLKGFKFDFDPENFKFEFDADDFKFDHDFGIGIPHILRFGDGDFDGHFQFKIKTDNDGETIEIERNDDGEIILKRTDQDGNVTTETFDDWKDLHDSDALELFGGRMFIGGPGGMGIRLGVRGNLKNMSKMRIQWRKQIDEALEDVREQLKGAHIKIRRFRDDDDGDGDVSSSAMSVSIANGRVVVTINEDGDVTTYKYDSIAELKQDNPDLWEKLSDVIGDDDDDDDDD